MNIFCLFLFTNSLTIALSYKLVCDYKTDPKWGFGCDVSSIDSTSDHYCKLTDVNGVDIPGKSFSDVKFLKIKNENLKFLPRGLHKKFSNVETLLIDSQKLSELTNDDLKEFGIKLKNLIIFSSSIKSLDQNLFSSTPNLNNIQIASRAMANIHENLFNTIKIKLKKLSINFPCMGEQVAENSQNIAQLIDSIQGSCYSSKYKPESSRECGKNLTLLQGRTTSGAEFFIRRKKICFQSFFSQSKIFKNYEIYFNFYF